MAANKARLSGTIILRAITLLCLLAAAGVTYARFSGYELLSVQSDSMRPVMRKGDAVLLKTGDIIPRPGQIVSFISPAQPDVVITHRVIGVDNKRGIVSTKGDNASAVDGPVAMWNLRGTVTQVLPGLGFALNVLRHPLGLLLVVYVPALGIILSEVRRLSASFAAGPTGRRPVHYVLHPARKLS